MKARRISQALGFVVLPLAVVVACGSDPERNTFRDDLPVTPEPGFGEGGLAEGGPPGIGGRDPTNCDEAARFKTYVGCDYWPTIGDNAVANVFDFAVAVANVGTDTANVTVTGPNGVNKKISVKGGELGKVFLPWVSALKGAGEARITASVLEKGGAYHLVSDKPVVVYQFSPIEFKAAGGEPGKDWSACRKEFGAPDCYSYSNDASLLLPSTAMTGTYRLMGSQGFSRHPINAFTSKIDTGKPLEALLPPYFLVTGTVDGTTVEVKLGPTGKVVAGGGISAAPAGGTLTFKLDAGDVAEVVSNLGGAFDFSGSLLKADKPVQVITGVACMNFPLDVTACDHVEETVFPAETLGKHYVVPTPTGPKNNKVAHVVRFYGNADGTTLTFNPSTPPGCPTTLNAGDVLDCGETVDIDFEVIGDKEFGVGMFQIGGERVDPDSSNVTQPQGDPSQSFAVTVEQYRKRYVFLAPTDYKTSFVDVVAGSGVKVTLDGQDMSKSFQSLAGTTYFTGRLELGSGKDGVHVLEGSEPIGIQVIGYGDNTSYQYPGGLNLSAISAAPVK